MDCEVNYCIYNKKSTCVLDSIQVNSTGMCASYEIVSVPEEVLGKYKKARLGEIEKIWRDYD